MRKLLLFALIISSLTALTQVKSGNIKLTSQAEVDSFNIDYPNLMVIDGNLTIDGSDYITNIDSLIHVTTIKGDLNLDYNYVLKNLNGLSNLETIDGSLIIHENDSLINLKGLDKLTDLGGDLIIDDCYVLESLEGLEGLTKVLGSVRITENAALSTVNGLNNIKIIEGSLDLEDAGIETLEGLENLEYVHGTLDLGNRSLKDISALSKLKRIGESLYISSPNLANIDALASLKYIGINLELEKILDSNLSGLQNLDTIGGDLEIWNLPNLEHLDNLSNLKYIGNQLQISADSALTSIDGLLNVSSADIEEVFIKNNPLLTDCAITPICEALNNPSVAFTIENNGNGCNSVNELIEDCGGSVDINLESSNIEIYFNNTLKQLHIKGLQTDTEYSIIIYNVLGGKVNSYNNISEQVILNTLNPGIYIAELKSVNINLSKKFLIK